MIKNEEKKRYIYISLIALFIPIFCFLFVSEDYLSFIKAAHITFAICWMAGILYLPRIFVYHAKCGNNSLEGQTFKLMEKRLLGNIMNPSMIIACGLGLWVGWKHYSFLSFWLYTKVSFVFLLVLFHSYLHVSCKKFYEDKNEKSEKFWRIMNEVPAIFMIIVVFLVAVKPFKYIY